MKKAYKTKKSSFNASRFNPKNLIIALLVFAVVGSYALGTSLAAKSGGTGGAGGGKGGHTSGGGTISLLMVTDNNSDGAPNYGDIVTFKVSAPATTQPYVRLDCYEGGVWVLSSSAGFFDSYPWPWTRNFTLGWSQFHTAGAASDCTATLYNGGTNYATLKFHVNP